MEELVRNELKHWDESRPGTSEGNWGGKKQLKRNENRILEHNYGEEGTNRDRKVDKKTSKFTSIFGYSDNWEEKRLDRRDKKVLGIYENILEQQIIMWNNDYIVTNSTNLRSSICWQGLYRGKRTIGIHKTETLTNSTKHFNRKAIPQSVGENGTHRTWIVEKMTSDDKTT